MKSKAKKIWKYILILTTLPLLGLVAGILFGKYTAYIKKEGGYSSWKELDSIHEFENIVDATSTSVWAQSADGKLYSYIYRCDDEIECNQWVVTPNLPEDDRLFGEFPIEKGTTCPEAYYYEKWKNPPGNLVECVLAIKGGMDIAPSHIVYYALTDDGKIWAWENGISMEWFDELISILFYSILFTCSGLFVAIITVVIISLTGRENRRANIGST